MTLLRRDWPSLSATPYDDPAVDFVILEGGDIQWRGTSLRDLSGQAWRDYRAGVQMVFQDTHSSLNPRKRIRTIIGEALAARGVTRAARPERIAELLAQVGIDHGRHARGHSCPR